MSNKKILIIDDDPGVVRLNQSLLGAQGFEVISADNGPDGLKKAEEEQPAAIFLDVILPQMHGFEVCEKLRSNEATKDIPVVIVTASGLEDVAEEETGIKADAYLSKPYNLSKVEEVLSKVLK